jgi:heme exporter protein D
MDFLRAFLQMDGYGGFVWPAFAVTVLVMSALLMATLRSLRAREATLAALKANGQPAGAGVVDDEA